MFKILFNLVFKIVGVILGIVLAPINAILVTLFPGIGSTIATLTETLNGLFTHFSWALGLVPEPIITVVLSILGFEIAKHTIYSATHLVIRMWGVIQRIKVW